MSFCHQMMIYKKYTIITKNNIEWIDMFFYKNIKLMIVGLFFLSHGLQYCSQTVESDCAKENIVPSSTQKALLRQRRKSFSIDLETVKKPQNPVMTSEEDLMKYVLLQTYDADVIDLWMNRYDLDRIAMHAHMQKTSSFALLKTLVNMSNDLKHNKYKIMNDLYENHKIGLTLRDDENKIQQRLWIDQMYFYKNDIQKNVEKNRSGSSLLAWPFIKEIQIVQKHITPGKR